MLLKQYSNKNYVISNVISFDLMRDMPKSRP